MLKLDKNQMEFVTPEGLLSFLYLYPGQAQPSFTAGSYAYKAELGCDIKGAVPKLDQYGRPLPVPGVDLNNCDQIVRAISYVAQAMDPDNWQRHVFGPGGRLKKLEETTRDFSKYPYYQGKYVLTFSQVHNAKGLGMQNANLADPTDRKKFELALDSRAPGAVRFPNLNDPADVAAIERMNQERMAKGLPAKTDYANVLLPVAAHEIWAGCYGRISGRAYWSANSKPATVLLALNFVLMTRQGERLVGERSADSAFEAFAPAGVAAAMQAPPQQFQQFQPQQFPPQNNGGNFHGLM